MFPLLIVLHEQHESQRTSDCATHLQTPDSIDRSENVYHIGPDLTKLKKSGAPNPHNLYFIGIIDVLTVYNTRKKAAHAAKTAKHGAVSSRPLEIEF